MSLTQEDAQKSPELLVAIATDNELTLSSHAGRAEHWSVYVINQELATSTLLWKLTLTAAGTLHEWHVSDAGNRHPLHQADYVIASSAGDGVRNKLALRNTRLITTNETEVQNLLDYFINGKEPPSNQEHEQVCLDPEHRAARSA